MNDQKNTAGHMIVWAFLMAVLFPASLLSASLSRELTDNANSITLQPYELFARRQINGAGSIYEFVNGTVDKEQGICNIDKGKLPSNEAFIFNEISILFANGAAVNKVGEVLYKNAAPAGIRNAEFEIRQGGRIVLNLPVASLNNHYEGTSVQDDFTVLGSLFYLRDDSDFTMSFKFPSGVSIPAGGGAADNNYAEVRMRGHRTVRKG